ncbi:hypothetical protein WJX82_003059 [Trebouxia sp. C0006]
MDEQSSFVDLWCCCRALASPQAIATHSQDLRSEHGSLCKTAHQLANADKEDLVAAGVASAIHAQDIRARAGPQSRNSTEGEAGPSKKPRTGHISETPLTEHSELLVNPSQER